MNTVLYGFFAVIITREIPVTRRWVVYAITSTWVALIGLSRLYLGAHWFFDVIGGLILGSVWVVLLGIAYRRHAAGEFSFKPMLIITLLVFVIAGGWHGGQSFQNEAERYLIQREQLHIEMQLWRQSDWQSLPAHRLDLEGDIEQTLTIQWLAARDEIKAGLQVHGWEEPEVLDFKTALKWLMPDPDIRDLPVLPQVHDGRHEEIRLVKDIDSRDRQLVLRLWRADLSIDDSDRPMWIGYVSYQRLVRAVPMLSLVETEEDITDAIAQFLPALDTWRIIVNERKIELPDTRVPLAGAWDKKVVLIMNDK
jgi:undecaprenyl-diphosphatase